MSFHVRRSFLTSALLLALSVIANTETRVPQIWNDAALADWATPLAKIQIRPSHYSSADYYSVPADNLRTYPVYLPDKEPPGYWEALQKRKPEPLVDFSKIRTKQDWSIAGARAFREIDSPLTRSDDPALIARARDAKTFANVSGLADGTVFEPRWVVTDRGVMLTNLECAGCHSSVTAERTIHYGGPPLAAPEGVGQTSVRNAFGLGPRALQRTFRGERMASIMKRMFEVPWDPDSRMDQLSTLVPGGTQQIFFNPHGVIPRNNGSVFYGTRVADLQLLRYSRYIDATATHRMRGPEDVARYAALITGADSMDFGTHRFLSDAQRRVDIPLCRRSALRDRQLSPVARAAEESQPAGRGPGRTREADFSTGTMRQLPPGTRLHDREVDARRRLRAAAQSPLLW